MSDAHLVIVFLILFAFWINTKFNNLRIKSIFQYLLFKPTKDLKFYLVLKFFNFKGMFQRFLTKFQIAIWHITSWKCLSLTLVSGTCKTGHKCFSIISISGSPNESPLTVRFIKQKVCWCYDSTEKPINYLSNC